MSDLSEFLLARIVEDEEEIARWEAAMEADEVAAVGVPSWVVMGAGLKIPRRVLAECEAKRRIVEAHTGYHLCALPSVEWSWIVANEPYVGEVCGELAVLALPYADHPDYREEWRA